MAKNNGINLRLFDLNTQTTTSQDLSVEMKTFYSDYLIDFARPELIHDQWSQKRPIPKNKGKTVEFRKYSPLPKATAALTEGVTPTGNNLSVSNLTCTVHQYGDYICVSDVLLLTAIDNNLAEATELLGDQAGRTLDTITREVLNGGTNASYSNSKGGRHSLVGGSATAADNDYLDVDDVKRAVRKLKAQNAKKINGYYVAIIHPDVSYDLRNDKDWKSPHEYQDTMQLYEGEIGMIEGVRFSETTESKVFHADDLTASNRSLTVASYTAASKKVVVDEAISAAEATALAGRYCIIDGEKSLIASATSGAAGAAFLTLTDARTEAPADGDVVYPGEAGAAGRDVYSTLFISDKAYGTTDVEGGGLEHIYKPLGSGGTADPLNQRATAGWKAIHAAVRLVENNIVRVESACTFEFGSN